MESADRRYERVAIKSIAIIMKKNEFMKYQTVCEYKLNFTKYNYPRNYLIYAIFANFFFLKGPTAL